MANYSTQQLDRTFNALSDPTRRAVLAALAKGPKPMKKLASSFDMALPSFSQHLDVLEESGLVKSTKQGRIRTYTIDTKQMKLAQEWLDKYRQMWDRRLVQLEAYLQNT